MNEEQSSLQDRALRPVAREGRLSARSWLGGLLIGFCLSGLGIIARADANCFDRCQAAIASCLAGAQGDPVEEFQCQGAYDDCGEQCAIQ